MTAHQYAAAYASSSVIASWLPHPAHTSAITIAIVLAARDDLNPANGVYPISALGHRDHAGIDAKYTTWAMMTGRPSPLSGQVTSALATGAQSGPTYDQQPPFVFSQSDYGNSTSHLGMPDSWTFPWVTINWPLKG